MAIWRMMLCMLALSGTARAQDELLLWKFTAGDSQLYRMTQTGHMDTNLGGSSDVLAEVHREFDFRWRVEEVLDEGAALIAVQVTRARLKVVGPGGQETEIDTGSDKPARGFAATLAPLFKTLLESELKAKMNTRGEVSELQLSEDLQIALSSKPVGKALGQLGSENDFLSLLQLGMPILPESESIAEGEQWETQRELTNPTFSSATARTVYRWEATRPSDEGQLAVIVPTTTVSFDAQATDSPQPKVSTEKTRGETLFNLAKGRLESSQMELSLKLAAEIGEKPIVSSLADKVTFEKLPEEPAE